MNILMVLTSYEQAGGGRGTTAIGVDDFAAPYYVLRDAGTEISLASPEGASPPVDLTGSAARTRTPAANRLREDCEARTALADLLRLDQIAPLDFDGAFYVAGVGSLWDLVANAHSTALVATLSALHRPVAFVGHAQAALCRIADTSGRPIVHGRYLTAYSHSEDTAAGLSDLLPFSLETELRRLGSVYSKRPDGTPHVVRDGWLITGQNAASSAEAAKALLDALERTRSLSPIHKP